MTAAAQGRNGATSTRRGVPQIVAAERHFLGALVNEPGAVLDATAHLGLEPEDFPTRGPVLEAVRRMRARGDGGADPEVLIAELEAMDALRTVGGATAISELYDDLPDPRRAVEWGADLKRARLHSLAAAVAKALPTDTSALSKLRRVAGELTELEAPGGVGILLADVPREKVEWLAPGRVPLAKITGLVGMMGAGKTTASLDLAAAVTRGDSWLGGPRREPAGVVVANLEDGRGDTLRPRLEAAGADLDRVLILQEVGDRPFTIPDDLEILERAIARVGAHLVIVDPLSAALSGRVDSHRDQDVRRALSPVAAIADRTRAAVLLILHLNKNSGSDPLFRVGGSVGLAAAARSVLLLGPDSDDDTLRVLVPLKTNLCAPPAAVRFRIEHAGDVARIRWLGETSTTAATLLAGPAGTEDRDRLTEARTFLRELLAGGPVPAREVLRQAELAAIGRKTLERAKVALRVLPRKGGFKDGWTWALPEDPPTQSPGSWDSWESWGSSGQGKEGLQEPQERQDPPPPKEGSLGDLLEQRLAHLATCGTCTREAWVDGGHLCSDGETLRNELKTALRSGKGSLDGA